MCVVSSNAKLNNREFRIKDAVTERHMFIQVPKQRQLCKKASKRILMGCIL